MSLNVTVFHHHWGCKTNCRRSIIWKAPLILTCSRSLPAALPGGPEVLANGHAGPSAMDAEEEDMEEAHLTAVKDIEEELRRWGQNLLQASRCTRPLLEPENAMDHDLQRLYTLQVIATLLFGNGSLTNLHSGFMLVCPLRTTFLDGSIFLFCRRRDEDRRQGADAYDSDDSDGEGPQRRVQCAQQ